MSELEKWSKVGDQVLAIVEFLEHIERQGYVIAEYIDTGTFGDEPIQQLCPTQMNHQTMICSSFGIDPRKLEAERRALLTSLQEAS